ncbi:ABC transporter permease [Clostridia bacterium OttesenSCG-928-O13]|nr:ABC transporter permease [Clostridia bacterium OttesenSCG-928-O13]
MPKEKNKFFKPATFVPVVSLVLALLVGTVFILLAGNNPITVYGMMFQGALGSQSGILQSLLQATPLIFCGLSVAIGQRGGLLNLGVEGQMYFGALFSALVGLYVKGIPHILHVILCVVAGMIGGALWGLLPVILKLKRGVHEVVSSLMLNYIALLFVEFLTTNPLHSGESFTAQTKRLEETATFTRLFPNSQVSTALFIAVAAVFFMYWFFKKTNTGYKINMTGANLTAAKASGIPSGKMMVLTMLMSGAVAGLAGVGETLGTHGRLVYSFSSGYGFTGIAVAMLGSSFITVIFSSLLFGCLRAGSVALSLGTNLSVRFINMLQGIIILLIAAPVISMKILQWRPLQKWREKRVQKAQAGGAGHE